MKIAILLLIIFIVLLGFRFLKIKTNSSKKDHRQEDGKIVDLEKDPKTDEYKPKK